MLKNWKRGNPVISGGHLLPPADNTYDLGSVAYSWRNAYIETAVYATSVVGSWSPSADGTYHLGTSLLEWQDLYLDGVAYIDTLYVEVKGRVNDDILWSCGTGDDIVFLNRSTTLTADTLLAGVITGASRDISALAANSLIISNVTTDGDILIACSDGGHSKQMIFLDGSTGVTHLGKPGTPGVAVNTGDVYIAGILEVDGASEFATTITAKSAVSIDVDNVGLSIGDGQDVTFKWRASDANANELFVVMPEGGGVNVPAAIFGDTSIDASATGRDLGLFDGVTQPLIAVIEKGAKYTSSSLATAAGAQATMTTVAAIFAASVVGDIVRVVSGTNTTPGWYWITTVTDSYNVVLDRNWCTGAVTVGVIVAYHDFTMLSADGICTRITDGAPTDASVEIDRDGWIIMDVGNNLLYGRSQSTWYHWSPDIASTHTLYVDIGATTSIETGTEHQPYQTIQAAVDAIATAADNSDDVAYTVYIAPGTYTETVTLEDDELYNLSFIALGGPAAGGYSNVSGGVILDPAGGDALESEVDNTNLHYLYFKGIRFIGTIHLVGEIQNTLFGEDALTFEDCGFEGFRTDGVVMTLANLERFTWVNGCIGRGAVITAQNIWSMSINGERFSDWPMDMSGACTLTATTAGNMPYHMDDENAGGDQMTFAINGAFVQRSSWTLAQAGTGVLQIKVRNGFMNGSFTAPSLGTVYGYNGIFNNDVTMNANGTIFLYNTCIKGTLNDNGCAVNTYPSET